MAVIRLVVTSLLVVAAPLVAVGQEREDRKQRSGNDEGYSVTISGEVDSKMAAVAGEMTTEFYRCYPRLIERFDNAEKPASRHIRIVFRRGIRVPAYCQGSQVTVSVEWLRQHPGDIGMLTHELTHAVQQYPQPNPSWLTEGIADYARKLYGPEEQPDWSLPELSPRNSWTDSYRVTARFLEWLDQTHPGTVDKLHTKLQAGAYRDDQFEEFTGVPLEKLWTQCVRELRAEFAAAANAARDKGSPSEAE